MVYLEGFLNEVLRIKSPAAGLLFRIAKEEVNLGNLKIAKGFN